MMKNNDVNNSPNDDVFTGTRVGVLIEALRSDFRVFGEGLDIVRDDVSCLKSDVSGLKNDVSGLKVTVDGIRINQARTLESITQIRSDIKTINIRLDHLESAKA